jgi:Asp-tRNA(Asn)/Glu-tRNA(Gln) amidotransferase A subunit family amidase
MGRSIDDVAMLLAVQAGYDPRAPLSYDDLRLAQWRGLHQTLAGVRFGWLGDLGGHLPFEPGVLALCEGACRLLEGAGAHVEPAAIDFDPGRLWQAWVLLRSHSISGRHDNDYRIPRHAVSSMLKRSGRPRTAIARAGSTSTRRGWSAARGTRRFSRCSIVSTSYCCPPRRYFPSR